MKREINLQESNRAEAFHMWMSSPMPMVTFLRPVGSKRPEVERPLRSAKNRPKTLSILPKPTEKPTEPTEKPTEVPGKMLCTSFLCLPLHRQRTETGFDDAILDMLIQQPAR